jgi:hypothetical protein
MYMMWIDSTDVGGHKQLAFGQQIAGNPSSTRKASYRARMFIPVWIEVAGNKGTDSIFIVKVDIWQ